ncbi:MAG: YcnI family protein, partial [Gemmataceae bacterium]|nr:YcnI family protein [Gemmataceae bacterium]
KSKLDKSYISHKKTITEDVRRIEWSGGPLASAYYDEFVIVGQVPDVQCHVHRDRRRVRAARGAPAAPSTAGVSDAAK